MKNITMIVLSAFILVACSKPENNLSTIQETQAIEYQNPVIDAVQPEDDQIKESTSPDLPTWYQWELVDVRTNQVFSINDFRGKVMLVETMAIWCPKCLQQQIEILELQKSEENHDDVVVISLDVDPNEDAESLNSYSQKNGFNWIYVVASSELIGEISNLYGSQFLNPSATPMFIIDRQGESHLLPFGVKSAMDLDVFLKPFLSE